MDDSVKKSLYKYVREFHDFSLHKKNIDSVVILHPNIQKVVYRFLDCLNNSGSKLYNLKQYDYLILIIAKLEKFTYVLQYMVFLSIRKYFMETELNYLKIAYLFIIKNKIYVL